MCFLLAPAGDIIGKFERGDISPSVDVVIKIAEALVDYLIGKNSLALDKEALKRLEDISKLKDENKNFIYNLIDMALRDMKTKRAYAG